MTSPHADGDGSNASTHGAETTDVPTLSFNADWSVTSSGAPTAGGKAIVHYDLARLPSCRAMYMGFPAWDVIAYWSVDGGNAHSASVTVQNGNQRLPIDVTIDVPYGHDLALWFFASDEYGCTQWDSNYGSNFHFAVQTSAPTLHFKGDWSIVDDGALTAGSDFAIDYDIARLPWCRQDYNGLQTWDVVVHYRFDGGAISDASLTTTSSSGRIAAPARVHAPIGARHVEMWFENTDRTGCDRWDSAYGANYGFDLR